MGEGISAAPSSESEVHFEGAARRVFMSRETFKKLESYKKKHALSDLALAREMEIYPIYLYRWRKAQRITGAYERIVEGFLETTTSKRKVHG